GQSFPGSRPAALLPSLPVVTVGGLDQRGGVGRPAPERRGVARRERVPARLVHEGVLARAGRRAGAFIDPGVPARSARHRPIFRLPTPLHNPPPPAARVRESPTASPVPAAAPRTPPARHISPWRTGPAGS